MGKWLTPNSSIFSNPLDCRKIELPGDLWLYVQGALELLAQDYNWEAYGTATPEETSQFFMDVLDEFSVSRCGMRFIDSATFTIFSQTFSWVSGYEIPITHASMPAVASGTSAAWVELGINIPRAAVDVFIEDVSGDAKQLYRLPIGYSTQHIIVPLTGGRADIGLQGAIQSGDSVSWAMRLIGWWD